MGTLECLCTSSALWSSPPWPSCSWWHSLGNGARATIEPVRWARLIHGPDSPELSEGQCRRPGFEPRHYALDSRWRSTPRVAAPRISRMTTATMAMSASIWMVVTRRATSVFGVMSPNPTVEKTLTVK
jgi:hypothetical protein